MKLKRKRPLPELAAEYLNTEFSERAFNTIRNNTFYLNQFVAFIGSRKIDPFSYQDWTKHAFARWSPNTAGTLAMSASSRFLNWMERCGHIARSPHRVTKSPIVKPPSPREPFTSEEFEKLKAAAKEHDESIYWAIICGWETGMSIGDVSMLKWTAVNFRDHLIGIHRLKTGECCIIPFRPDGECHEIMEKKFTQQRSDYPNNPDTGVFYVDTELALLYKRGAGDVSGKFRKVSDMAGMDPLKTFHNLRASYCSRLANAGVQTVLACQMTGHKNPEIFKRYVTPDTDRLHEQSQMAWEKQA